MATTNTNTNSKVDPNSDFCSETKIFHSLRPSITLPPPSQPLCVTQFIITLLYSTSTNLSESPFLINDVTGHRITYSEFLHQTKCLASSLQKQYSLSKGNVVFVLCPNSLNVPVLYFSLLSLGVIISPANPADSISELTHQIQLCRPAIVFALSDTSHKLPPTLQSTILIDSLEFSNLLTDQYSNIDISSDVVKQSDIATIVFSFGTTGRNKGILLTHGNLIGWTAAFPPIVPVEQRVSLIRRPLYSPYLISYMLKAASIGQTLVLTQTNDYETTLRAVQMYKLNHFTASPSFVVEMVKSEITKCDLSSQTSIGAPLGKEVSAKFTEKFPNVELLDLSN